METELSKFDQLSAEIATFIAPAKAVVVDSKETCERAMTSAQQVKKLEKAVEARRKELVGPLNDQVKRINDYAKKILEPLAGADSHIKKQLIGWERKLEDERREAQRKIDAEAAAQRKRIAEAEAEDRRKKMEAEKLDADVADLFGAPAAAPTEPAAPSFEEEQRQAEIDRERFLAEERLRAEIKANEANRVSGVQRPWTFEVTDPLLVPTQYWTLDEKKIRAAVKAGTREIPGVSIFQDMKIAIRT